MRARNGNGWRRWQATGRPRVRGLLPLLLLAAAGLTPAGCVRSEPAPLGRVAFVRGDTLFVQALPAGRPRARAGGRALVSPRWSPTGEWVAYAAADGLHLTRADGSAEQKLAADVGAFAWSPTDDRVAYVAGGNLIVARAGGMGVALAEQTRDAAVEGVAWSDDGEWLAFGTLAPPGAAAEARPGLWRIPARGGRAAPVALPPIPFTGAPLLRGWTGDGARILALLPDDLRTGSVASAGAPLYALPVAGGVPERLADSVLPYPDFVAPQPAGVPGGGLVAFVTGGGEATWRDKRIVVAHPGAAAGAARALSAPARAAISPAWSPGGERLAWAGLSELPLAGGVDASVALQSRRVVVAEAASGAAHWLGGPPGRQELPRWCADGRHLLLAHVDPSGTATLWLAVDGEAGRQVAGPLAPPGGAGGDGWSGVSGHIAWGDIVDYWPGRAVRARAPGGQ